MGKRKLFGKVRAEIPDFISDIFSFFLYLLFFLTFFLLFSLSFGGCNKLEAQTQEIIGEWNTKTAQEQLLLNYARTNLSVDGNQTTYAGLIDEACASGNYGLLKEKTKELMLGGVNGVTQNRLGIKCRPNQLITVEIFETVLAADCPYRLRCSEKDAELMVPLTADEDGELSYATLILKSCRFLVPQPSRPLTELEKETIAANIERCIR